MTITNNIVIEFNDDDSGDNADIFADGFISIRRGAKNPGELPKPLAELTEEEAAELGEKHRKIVNRKKSTRRRLEGTASNKLREYLFKTYKAVTTRVNSGEWLDSAGNTIRGAETGTSDILACVPINIGGFIFGIYFAFEVKSIANKSDGTDNQKVFIARVIGAGGAGAVVRTSLDVDAVIEAKRQAMIGDLRQLFDRFVKAQNDA
jgi:hypothetical protein